MDTIRFGAFMGALVGSFRMLELFFGLTFQKRNRFTRALAGAGCGLALCIDSKARRSTIALYMCIRAMDVGAKYITEKGYITPPAHTPEILFAMSNSIIMYSFILEPQLMPTVSRRRRYIRV